jgi:hypothetical protein
MSVVEVSSSKAAVWLLVSALALGCSTNESAAKGDNGGTGAGSGGTAGTSGDTAGSGAMGGAAAGASTGGSGAVGAGVGGSSGAGGSAGTMVSTNPLCPTSGPIVPGSMPFPGGVEVASPETDAKLLAVSDDFVYWANDNIIRRISVADNTEQVILDRSDTDFTLEGLAIDETNVYFSEAGTTPVAPGPLGVAKVPLDGQGDPVSLANEGPDATASSMAGLTVADGYVYFLNLRTQEIARVSVDGGDATVIVREANPSTMTVAGGYLWFMHPMSNASDNVNLLRVPIDAVAPPADTPSDAVNVPPGAEAVAPVFNYHPTGVSADADYVYYDDANKVMRVPIDGGTPELVAQADDHSGFAGSETTYVGFIAPAKSGVFWDVENGPACGSLMQSAFDGSSSTPFVSAVTSPWLLGVNSKYVYFSAAGQILRVPL